jgi:hypothetical protein
MIPGTAVFADSNFAPVINPNGSVVGLMRRSVVTADHWKNASSYRLVSQWNDHGEVRSSNHRCTLLITTKQTGVSLPTRSLSFPLFRLLTTSDHRLSLFPSCSLQDPYVYKTSDGIYHNIVHIGRADTHGLHYLSLDGLVWTASPGFAYNSTIAYNDGTSVTLGCRERPHIMQDANGNVVALTNGAAAITCHTAGGDDYAFTSLQLVQAPTSYVQKGIDSI